MKNPSLLLASASCIAFNIGTVQAATVSTIGTTGVFDAASNANSIDNDPTGQLAAFTSSVATAHANNLGGVIDWSTGAGTLANSTTSPGNTLGTTVAVAYGVGGSQTLTITPDRSLGLYTNNVASQVSALSNNTSLLPNTGTFANDVDFGMSFSGADVLEVGFGMLARSTYGSGVAFSATATFSDSSISSAINFTLASTLGNGAGSSDTFLHFAAPSGLTISAIDVEFVSRPATGVNDAQTRPSMDDLGFIVAVPEPSGTALMALGAMGLLFRRRR